MLGMDDEEIRDFLPLPKVLTGIFHLCENMFDLRLDKINCTLGFGKKTILPFILGNFLPRKK